MADDQYGCEDSDSTCRTEKEPLDDAIVEEMAGFFKIFGDSTRIHILWALRDKMLCVQELSEDVGMSPSAVSHQLNALKKANLVKSKRQGKNIYYSLCDEHIEIELNTALQHAMEGRK